MKKSKFIKFKYTIFAASSGFTLAEVLITLAIIGVVASMVIPNVLNSVNDQELKIKWKKEYGVLEQATRMILLQDEGGMFSENALLTNLGKDYSKYLNYTKYCDSGPSDCWHKEWKSLDGKTVDLLYNYSITGSGAAGVGGEGWVLNDGSLIALSRVVSSNVLTTAYIDVNGFKGPNTQGKDIFAVYITTDGIKPYGTDWNMDLKYRYGDTCRSLPVFSTPGGLGCSAKYLYN